MSVTLYQTILTSNLKLIKLNTQMLMSVKKDRSRSESDKELKTNYFNQTIKELKNEVVFFQKLLK